MSRIVRFTPVGLSVLALCAACGGGGGSSAGPSPPPPPPPPASLGCPAIPASTQPADSLAGIVDSAALAEVSAQRLPGLTIAVAKQGVVLYSHAYGYADLATCRQMQVGDPMQIGSVTKQFTAASVLQLEERGLIDLDHTVASYLPAYPFDSRITVRMLLNQTSGMPDYIYFPSLQQYALTGGAESIGMDAISHAALLFIPGTAHMYSNSNYFVLGSIIEAVSGVSYADYLTAHVYPLAGISHTTYLQPSNSASPYGNPLNGDPFAGQIEHPSVNFAAGQLWSTVEDLAEWDDAWLTGKIVSQASIDLMITPAPVPYYQPAGIPSDYGMGWITHADISGHKFIWHNGLTSSYSAFNGVLMDTGFTVTVLTNYTVGEEQIFLPLAEKLVRTICTTPAAGGC